MKTRCSWLFVALFFAPLGALCAQAPDHSSGQQPATAPAQAQSPDPSPAASKKKPRKVWTNDDVGGISGGISVVGKSSLESKEKDKRASQLGQTGPSVVALLRKELQTLRGQLAQTERQISDLRNFKAGNASPSGGVKVTGRYTMNPVEGQIRQLEQKRKQIQARIDDVEDQARKMGIEPGDLR